MTTASSSTTFTTNYDTDIITEYNTVG
jgi:hypothetical protein